MLSLVLGGLVLIAFVGIAIWVLMSFERRVEQIPVGYSAEARRNPLLAAERFLSALGVAAEAVPGRSRLWHLPPSEDVLVTLGLGPLSAERRARLLDWLEQGGQLVVEAIEVWREEAPPEDLLSDLGLRLRQADGGEDERPSTASDAVLARSSMASDDRPLSLAFQAEYWLEGTDADEPLAVLDGRARALRRAIGKGQLVVLSDSKLLTNAEIGRHDHAAFLARLVRPAADGKVWLLYDSSLPWLGALLWALAPYTLASAVLAVVVWLWSLGDRLGPIRGAPDRRRRDLIEHLDAAGDFLWRHGGAAHLIEASRKRILGDWLRDHPEAARADSSAQAQAIAAATDEPLEQVYRALHTQPQDARALVDQARLLQRLRRRKPRQGARPASTQPAL